jgi:RNA 2',3'-cyclic 3'-phosphodiesterase
MPPNGPTRRLFVGLMADQAARAAIAELCRRWVWPSRARLTAVDNLHLTLVFLGDVAAEDELRLQAGLSTVRFDSLSLVIDSAELWRGVAVLVPREDSRLRALRAEIADVVSRVALPLEARPWKPHVTLARDAIGARPPESFVALPWDARQLSLVWSRGARQGYEVVASWPNAAVVARHEQ